MTKKETIEASARGNGCLGKSQDDEPVFVLVARDPIAPATIRTWAAVRREQALIAGTYLAEQDKINDALDLADEMDAWRYRQKKETV